MPPPNIGPCCSGHVADTLLSARAEHYRSNHRTRPPCRTGAGRRMRSAAWWATPYSSVLMYLNRPPLDAAIALRTFTAVSSVECSSSVWM